jgi:hypothetical protein
MKGRAVCLTVSFFIVSGLAVYIFHFGHDKKLEK